MIRQERARQLHEDARDLQTRARLEDITVRRNPITKQTKKGERTYYRWICSWQEGDKTVTKYLGSCGKMGEAEALEKAKGMKANELGLRNSGSNCDVQYSASTKILLDNSDIEYKNIDLDLSIFL